MSQSVEFSVRTENLSWQHHRHVAPLPKTEQIKWLQRGEKEHWSAKELRDEIKSNKVSTTLAPPAGQYNLIYADQPWRYGFADSFFASHHRS